MENKFIESFNALAVAVHNNAVSHGWDRTNGNDAEAIALMHSELSEALEGMRHNNPMSDHIPTYHSVEEELADVIIRIMDFAYCRKHPVAEAVIEKMKFNITRPYKHGGKTI